LSSSDLNGRFVFALLSWIDKYRKFGIEILEEFGAASNLLVQASGSVTVGFLIVHEMRTGLYEEKKKGKHIYFRGRNTHNQRKEKKKSTVEKTAVSRWLFFFLSLID
jgi:hypothetical protein